MDLKPYQPHRKEFLINTDWGTAKDAVSKEEVKNRGLVIFKGRWVTKEERTALKNEYHAYYSIRQLAWLLICLSVPFLAVIVLYLTAAARSGGINEATVLYIFCFIAGSAGLISGIGLLKYRRWARNLATFAVLLPVFPLGLIGLYYLHRKTAKRIFDEPDGGKAMTDLPQKQEKKKSPIRVFVWAGALIIGAVALVFVYTFGNNQIVGKRAETLIGAVNAFKEKNHRYPERLDELAPDFIERIPKAKDTLMFNSFFGVRGVKPSKFI